MGGPSYTRIPGSDALLTRKRGTSGAAVVEEADRSSLARAVVDVAGARVSVGRVVLRGAAVPLLLDVVDRLFPLLQAEELAVYVHLYRLAVAVEKNVCRVSRAELTRRTRLADRRLGRAIAGLVAKRAVVLVDRDRDGTLYRVVFPDELPVPAEPTTLPTPTTAPTVMATNEATHAKTATRAKAATRAKKVTRAKATALKTSTTAAASASASKSVAPPAATTPLVRVRDGSPRSVGDVCAWFADRHGSAPGRAGSDVASCVLELLEEGRTFAQIPALLDSFVQQAPKTTPLRDLHRFV